tara:strand:+ start:114 stop:1079 length:966 start_codon:yes stop_codon:yes gene_type:complete
MLNFLRNNQPFFFILSACILLVIGLPIQYYNLTSEAPPFFLSYLFKLPVFAYYLVFAGLSFFTSFKINRIINKSVLFPKSFYLPGFLYLALIVFYAPVEYLYLPAISNLFIVLAMGEFFQIFRNESCKNLIFKANLYLFLSVFFSPLNFVLIPISWVILFIIRPFEWREYIMPIIVFLLFAIYIVPFALVYNNLDIWLITWWKSLTEFMFLPEKFLTIIYIIFLSVGLIFSINPISNTFVKSNNRYKKIIWVIISLLFFSFIIALISVFNMNYKTPYLYPFFIPMSIFIANGMIRSRFKWIIDLFLVLFISSNLLVAFKFL